MKDEVTDEGTAVGAKKQRRRTHQMRAVRISTCPQNLPQDCKYEVCVVAAISKRVSISTYHSETNSWPMQAHVMTTSIKKKLYVRDDLCQTETRHFGIGKRKRRNPRESYIPSVQ